MMKYFNLVFFLWITTILSFLCHGEEKPIVTDSRIKTFVYSANEVFPVILHYGYQANIEFARNEEVQTLSVGNNFALQINPVGNRIFLKTMEENTHTNMTVITNKRTYQFDIISRDPAIEEADRDLVYVMRFYYPNLETTQKKDQNALYKEERDTIDTLASMPKPSKYNFHYTLTGPKSFAPIKIFDDGQATFMQLPKNSETIPHISSMNDKGEEIALQPYMQGPYLRIQTIANRFVLRSGEEVVCVYNEKTQRAK